MILHVGKKETGNPKKHVFYFPVILIFILFFWIIYSAYLKKNTSDALLQNTDKNLTIFVASDIHYLSDKLTDHGAAYEKYVSSGDGKQLKYIDAIMDAFVSEIKKLKPDILIVSGDLTNNGEKASHLDLAEKFKAIENGGTDVYVIPGNHDIFNPWAREFKKDKQYPAEYISDKDFSKIYESYGYDKAISRDENSLSYLVAPSGNLWLLMLDSNKYQDNISVGVPSTDGLLKMGTLQWIEKCCKLAKEHGAYMIAVMHHNILDHSEVIRDGYTLNDSGQTRILLKDYQINLVLSGHIHVQDISSDKAQTDPLYDIASGAVSVYPHLYGVLKFSSADGSLNYVTQSVDVDSWAKAKHKKDNVLLNFKEYSKDYFSKLAYNKAYDSLSESGYQEEQIKLMADVIKTLNLRYFSGTENLNAHDVVNSEGYKLWTDFPDSFLKSYMASIISDNDTDDNHLTLKLNK